MTNGEATDFLSLELEIKERFLPALLQEKKISPEMRNIIGLPVKATGMSLPNPAETPTENYKTFSVYTSHLSRSIRGKVSFKSVDHLKTIHKGKSIHQERRNSASLSSFTKATAAMIPEEKRVLQKGHETEAWLFCILSFVNGTQLAKLEFRDTLRLRYNIVSLKLPPKCDGCNTDFTVDHALKCIKGGLVVFRHNEIRNKLISVCQMCFSKRSVRDEPNLTNISNDSNKNQNKKTKKGETINDNQNEEAVTTGELRGDLLVRNLWRNGTSCVIDVRMSDTDAKSYRTKDPHQVLKTQENEKKKKYLETCVQMRRDFTPFVLSVDGLFGEEAKNVIKRLAAVLSEKWTRPYSSVCGYLNT